MWLPLTKAKFNCYGMRFEIACQNMCDQREIEYWSENNRVKNNGIESQKNLACFQTYRTDV